LADWLEIDGDNLDSHCGDTTVYTLEDALNQVNNKYWMHYVTEDHWFILDLGQTYTISKIHGRSNYNYDPIVVDVYISDSKESWGDAVAEDLDYSDTDDWIETEITPKDGRYVKVIITDTESASRFIQYGKPGGLTLFDVYGEVESLGETSFPTLVGTATGWTWAAATVDSDTAPRSTTANGLGWTWDTVSDTADHYIISGSATSWNWCAENA